MEAGRRLKERPTPSIWLRIFVFSPVFLILPGDLSKWRKRIDLKLQLVVSLDFILTTLKLADPVRDLKHVSREALLGGRRTSCLLV